jgi:hypothetical protein
MTPDGLTFHLVSGLTRALQDDSDPILFAQEVRNCAGSTVMLGIWSAKVCTSSLPIYRPIPNIQPPARANEHARCTSPSPPTQPRSA